jgi:hypothetical protein
MGLQCGGTLRASALPRRLRRERRQRPNSTKSRRTLSSEPWKAFPEVAEQSGTSQEGDVKVRTPAVEIVAGFEIGSLGILRVYSISLNHVPAERLLLRHYINDWSLRLPQLNGR